MSIADFLAVVSLVVGVGAIALAFVFYRWTDTASRETRDAAKAMEASIEKLEAMFDKMYATTFAALNETHKDVMNHVLHTTVDNEELVQKVSEAIQKTDPAKDEEVAQVSREVVSDVAQSMMKTVSFPTAGELAAATHVLADMYTNSPSVQSMLATSLKEMSKHITSMTASALNTPKKP